MLQISIDGQDSLKGAIRELQKLEGAFAAGHILDDASAIVISRIRRRYLQSKNPDGSAWPLSRAAAIRKGGGKTWAKGGHYAPGGWKTGGGTLFSSGNLFHSIQLSRLQSPSERSIMTDVPYAAHYSEGSTRQVIGTNAEDMDLVAKAIIRRITKR